MTKLLELRLVAVERQGRHRYHRLASSEVARALEALMTVASASPSRHRPVGPRDEALRAARACYDHLAGRLGVSLIDGLQARGHIFLGEGACAVTDHGRSFLSGFGIDLETPAARPLCRTCLDWSERRPHLAGRLGAALFERTLALGWIRRAPGSRVITVTTAGRHGFAATFGVWPDGTTTPPT